MWRRGPSREANSDRQRRDGRRESCRLATRILQTCDENLAEERRESCRRATRILQTCDENLADFRTTRETTMRFKSGTHDAVADIQLETRPFLNACLGGPRQTKGRWTTYIKGRRPDGDYVSSCWHIQGNRITCLYSRVIFWRSNQQRIS